MLDLKISDFIHYCQVSNFSKKSIKTLSEKLHEFNRFISSQSIGVLSEISYKHLREFVIGSVSVHVKKSRVWALRQFFHFLKLNHLIEDNIALGIPYPKIEKTVPHYLTPDEYNQILSYFYQKAISFCGLRNLVLIMLFGFLGLRLKSIILLNIADGLKITKFESKILDKGGNRFEGFSGLAMLLVDLDYEPDKPFDMDKTVFAKEIDEDGSVKIDGITKSVGLIAIDKHGNESKPVIV